MTETERTTPAPEGATPELTRLDQAAWEAPALRPTFTAYGDREVWAHPCPPWCTGDGPGHDLEATLKYVREHSSEPLLVRLDSARSYVGTQLDDDRDGIVAANIACHLIAGSRSADDPRIALNFQRGGPDRFLGTRLAPMYPDEVRELIAVLQHLLKVSLEGKQS